MPRYVELMLAAMAPIIFGSTYIVTTQLLPQGYPLTASVLRALPAGLLLLMVTRQLPPRAWLGRIAVLGALNFAIFWAALFVAAYRLPGGVAATVGSIQPLLVLVLAHLVLAAPLRLLSVTAALAGLVGVALLVLQADAGLDLSGIVAAQIGALSMALGVVLTRKWQPPVPALTFTAWQLTAGGLILLPVALWAEPSLRVLDARNIAGFLWLGLFGAALTYYLWFRAIARLGPAAVTGLGFLSPLTAVLLGWALLGQTLTPQQTLGALIVLISIWLGGRASRPDPSPSPVPAGKD